MLTISIVIAASALCFFIPWAIVYGGDTRRHWYNSNESQFVTRTGFFDKYISLLYQWLFPKL